MSASREKRLRRELREAENNSDIVKKVKKKKAPMNIVKARKIKNFVTSVVAIVLVVVFALLIFVNTGYLQTHAAALTVGSHKVSPAMFNYFYQDTYYNLYSQYASYGMWDYMVDNTKPIADQECFLGTEGATWSEYLSEAAAESALQVYTLFDAAMEAGFTLDETTQATVDATADTLATQAESYGFAGGDDYLEASYGKGASVETYAEYVELQQIAAAYANVMGESFTYDDQALRSYYDEHAETYDKVNYRVFAVATENDDTASAKETADAMAAELASTEDSFIKAAQAYAPEEQAESYEDADYTLRRGATRAALAEEQADWLFDNARVSGESNVFATETGYSVIMFVSRDNNDYETINVRHILVQVGASGEDGSSTDEDWATALTAIEEIEALWNESEMTEDAFAALAGEHTQDPGSSANGGLYENVYKGQMVSEFEDWCFDTNRQIGDTGIVKTDYGYHFMYFSGYGDLYWKTLADADKRVEDYNNWYTEQSGTYTVETKAFGQWLTTKRLAQLSTTTA